jgi:hypothetical protein
MAQWVRLQLGGGMYRGRRLVSAGSVKEMHAPQMLIPLDSLIERLRPSTHFQAYGLVPEEQLGVVVLANGGERGRALTNALFLRVVDAYLGGVARDWGAELLRVRDQQMMRDSVEQAKQEQARIAGTKSSLLLPWHFDTFQAKWRDPEQGSDLVTFGLNASGKVDHLRWPGLGEFARDAASP